MQALLAGMGITVLLSILTIGLLFYCFNYWLGAIGIYKLCKDDCENLTKLHCLIPLQGYMTMSKVYGCPLFGLIRSITMALAVILPAVGGFLGPIAPIMSIVGSLCSLAALVSTIIILNRVRNTLGCGISWLLGLILFTSMGLYGLGEVVERCNAE